MRLLQTGAEMQVVDELNDVSGENIVTISTTQHTGVGSAASYRMYLSDTSWVQDYAYTPIPTTPANVYYKADVKIAALTSSYVSAYPVRFYGSNYIASVGIYNSSGVLHLFVTYGTSSTKVYDVAISPGIGDWFRLEAHFDSTPADGSEIFEVKVNGTQIMSDTNLTLSGKTMAYAFYHLTSSSTGSTHTADMYMDNISVNDATGSVNNSWIGEEYIAPMVPTGAGDSNPTSGTYTSINEIPATTTDSSSSNRIQLQGSTTSAYFTINPSALQSYDRIKAVSVPVYIKEATAATTSYQTAIKSASGGGTQTTTAADAGNTVVRISPNGITAQGRLLISETDPDTASAWKVTGTNSLTNAQIGVLNLLTAETRVTFMAAMVAYTPGSPRTPDMLIMFW